VEIKPLDLRLKELDAPFSEIGKWAGELFPPAASHQQEGQGREKKVDRAAVHQYHLVAWGQNVSQQVGGGNSRRTSSQDEHSAAQDQLSLSRIFFCYYAHLPGCYPFFSSVLQILLRVPLFPNIAYQSRSWF
jgi:hypothetical protein